MAQRRQSGGRRRKPAKRSNAPLIIISAAVVVVIAVILLINRDSGFKYKSGITIDGISISGLTREKAEKKLSEREDELLNGFGLTFVYEDIKSEVTAEGISLKSNLSEILDEAKTLSDAEKDYTLSLIYNEEKLKKETLEFAKKVDIEKVEPKITDFSFETQEFKLEDGKDGRTTDTEALYAAAAAAIGSGKPGTVTATVNAVPRKTTLEKLRASVGKIAYFSTVCTNNENSEHNMRLAMELMDKSVVEPGKTFSFNEATGDSTTAEGGWVQSGAWMNGKLVDQYGGGLCQAATTLYNCGLLAGMEPVERYCHLQPSSYCEIGLDATIDYGYLDVKLKNTSDYPIYIISQMNGKDLEMTMYGYISDEYDYIELSGWSTGEIPMPDPEFEEDSSLASGEYVRERKGYSGCTAEASRTYYDEDGNEIKTQALSSSKYSAVAPLYRIGPGTDTSLIDPGSESGTTVVAVQEPSSEEGGTGGEITAHPQDGPVG